MSISSLWSAAAPGAVIDLQGSTYLRDALKPSKRPAGSAPVTIRNGFVLRDDAVGSTDTLILKSGLRDLVLQLMDLEVDDRAGLKTEYSGARKVSLIDCTIHGRGNGPEDGAWKDVGKWGQHHYQTGAWSEIRTRTERVFQEHRRYDHNHQGNQAFAGCFTRWCGRTNLQYVNRISEGPQAKGDIFVQDDYVEDVCIGDGGSAYSFRLGKLDSVITLERSYVRLGCNQKLAYPFHDIITGWCVFDAPADAYPGVMKEVRILDCDTARGEFYPGKGNAKRSDAKFGAIGKLVISGGSFKQYPGCHKYLFEFTNNIAKIEIGNIPVIEGGFIKFKNDPIDYASFDALIAMHPELKA